ncbi:RelA/SpoT domain-containing protein [Lentzea nigeriaca]|uniref:RelA/SpoT domain-containing protein n=1 Tax=Lentzea nigeriaca TaxID=1128665 RepID=UPI00195D5ECF|nr:RelA/SpoT domain-containing protein [Lentzea nigeriaca]MBM7859465.1 ppGpp synthetase/RelA/SpoT-type nucleotidyltransferase [Lentzea nigeriaca]
MTSPNWKARYAEIRPTYEAYEKKLRELVTTVLEHAKIDVVQVEGRVKTVDSFAEKISRKSGKYADPLKDMTDLVGLRIIAYYVEDVDKIVSLLRNEFR